MAAFDRRSFAGGAADTTLTGGITGSDLSISIADATGWPSGSGGDFIAVIDRGEATEEKVLVNTRSTTTLTVDAAGRGYDGTTQVAHDSGATIAICLSAQDLDEANDHVSDSRAVAHDAAKIGYTAGGDLDATNVGDAIDELETDLAAVAAAAVTVKVAKATKSDGDKIIANSGAAVLVDADLDLTVAAAAGDEIGLSILGAWGSEAFNGLLNFATRVSDADVNWVFGAGATTGPMCWREGDANAAPNQPISGELLYTVEAEDISGGNVTFRLYGAAAGTTKVVEAGASTPLRVQAKNYGPG